MKFYAIIKDLGDKFKFDSPTVLKEISNYCPIIKELFCREPSRRGPRGYSIKYTDPRLKKLMSQIDKYRLNGEEGGYDSLDSLKDYFVLSFRRLAHLSMMKKKDIEVRCLNSMMKKKDIEVRCLD